MCGHERPIKPEKSEWDLGALTKAQGVQPIDDIGKLKIEGYDE